MKSRAKANYSVLSMVNGALCETSLPLFGLLVFLGFRRGFGRLFGGFWRFLEMFGCFWMLLLFFEGFLRFLEVFGSSFVVFGRF